MTLCDFLTVLIFVCARHDVFVKGVRRGAYIGGKGKLCSINPFSMHNSCAFAMLMVHCRI